MHTTSVPPSVPGMQEPPHFSPARQHEGLIFVSGQMAFDGQWRIAGDSVAEQTQRSLERIAAILGEHGAQLADVVKTTVWLTRCEDFRQVHGMALFDYVSLARAERARALLQEGTRSVTDIALDVGYGHTGNFSTAFKRRYGMSPIACRKMARQGEPR